MSVQAETEDATVYRVVINHEEQYSIWPDSSENPRGWTSVGVVGSKAECLSYIEAAWTDMRPLSLRKAMEQMEHVDAAPEPAQAASPIDEESLPVRLSRGPQPVELGLRPEKTVDALIRQIETGYVHVRFTETRGGTELTFPLEPGSAESIKEQIARDEGPLRLSGNLTLDYVPVRCVADIDLSTFAGTGKLEITTS
jgi:uncharacterized protein YbdZ (MbtH family)